jgi:radical SAM/Cys-rich protein
VSSSVPTRSREAAPPAASFDDMLGRHGRSPLRARTLTTLQVNVGKLCNQACAHCHVDAGPHQRSAAVNMQPETAALVVATLRTGVFANLDLTGGAPELNASFRSLVVAARALGVHVMDRCNLTVLLVPGQEDLAEFLAGHQVEIVASLPFYAAERTDAQRGRGTFEASIRALRRLNALGYGAGDPRLRLDLVYNPVGCYLPANQADLERDFKQQLQERWGIRFDRLFALANLPIHRFLDYLRRTGNEERYRRRLEQAFNPLAADGVMCRDLISVGPDGTLYDCDFNQQVGLPLRGPRRHLRDFAAELGQREIATARHCFGCTAGAGSSCGGATVLAV